MKEINDLIREIKTCMMPSQMPSDSFRGAKATTSAATSTKPVEVSAATSVSLKNIVGATFCVLQIAVCFKNSKSQKNGSINVSHISEIQGHILYVRNSIL